MPVIPTSSIESELAARPALTPEEQDAVRKKTAALDKLLAETGNAKYKLEVMFGEERSYKKPFPGAVTWWESGNKLHGGGDSKMYLCPSKELKKSNCEAFIPDSANGLNFIVCPSCGSLWRGEEVYGEVFYRLSMAKWADVLLSWFRRLDMNADIRIKYAATDIRSAARREQEKQMGGELLAKARYHNRSIAIYPLRNLILDCSNGADMRGRILAFLTA